MTWFKVDDHLHSHRKAMRAGTEAMGLWVLAGSWSGAEESDGWVPSYVLTRLAGPGAEALADQLVSAGLWHADTVDSEDGYRFHEWETYQPMRAQLEAKREDARERMRRARSQGGSQSVRANSEGTSRAVTPTRPDPTRPKKDIPSPDGEAAFAAWWDEYPRKVGKDDAARKYAKALAKVGDPQVLLDGLRNSKAGWRAEERTMSLLPHAATWLHQGRWADEVPLPDMPGPAGPARPTTTLAQCEDGNCPGTAHKWTDGRNNNYCQGA